MKSLRSSIIRRQDWPDPVQTSHRSRYGALCQCRTTNRSTTVHWLCMRSYPVRRQSLSTLGSDCLICGGRKYCRWRIKISCGTCTSTESAQTMWAISTAIASMVCISTCGKRSICCYIRQKLKKALQNSTINEII